MDLTPCCQVPWLYDGVGRFCPSCQIPPGIGGFLDLPLNTGATVNGTVRRLENGKYVLSIDGQSVAVGEQRPANQPTLPDEEIVSYEQ